MNPKHRSGPSDAPPQRTSPYPQSRLAGPHDLVAVAEEIAHADAMVRTVTTRKLEHIARQMRALKEEAERTLAAAQRDAELHHVSCTFSKRVGEIYHLYERPDGTRYFSMLSPKDWGLAPPHTYRGGYRLETDMAFTPAEDADRIDRERDQLQALLESTDEASE